MLVSTTQYDGNTIQANWRCGIFRTAPLSVQVMKNFKSLLLKYIVLYLAMCITAAMSISMIVVLDPSMHEVFQFAEPSRFIMARPGQVLIRPG